MKLEVPVEGDVAQQVNYIIAEFPVTQEVGYVEGAGCNNPCGVDSCQSSCNETKCSRVLFPREP